jgi:hypothetical protein
VCFTLGTQKPCPNYLPTRSDETKSSVADGYQSIGECLAKILIDRTAANLARPVTWSKKRAITSFNARINFVTMQCTIALRHVQDFSVVESLAFSHRRPSDWRFGVD